uniref:Protein kinase domain-containing protein n=1 Tax=Macrostomum lignano TaxID=282301 RepID=A0A1I8F3Y1_9PLAT
MVGPPTQPFRPNDKEKLMQDSLSALDLDIKNLLIHYFEFLDQWVLRFFKEQPDASKEYKEFVLENEWSFIRNLGPYITTGQELAVRHFCKINSHFFQSTGEFFLDSFKLRFSSDQYPPLEVDAEQLRSLKSSAGEARERAMKSLGFVYILKKDLEIAHSYESSAPAASFMQMKKLSDFLNSNQKRDWPVNCPLVAVDKTLDKNLVWTGEEVTIQSSDAEYRLNLASLEALSSILENKLNGFIVRATRPSAVSTTSFSTCSSSSEAPTRCAKDIFGCLRRMVQDEGDIWPQDALHQGFRVSFEYNKELVRLYADEVNRVELFTHFVELVELYWTFIKDRCEEGQLVIVDNSTSRLRYLATVIVDNSNVLPGPPAPWSSPFCDFLLNHLRARPGWPGQPRKLFDKFRRLVKRLHQPSGWATPLSIRRRAFSANQVLKHLTPDPPSTLQERRMRAIESLESARQEFLTSKRWIATSGKTSTRSSAAERENATAAKYHHFPHRWKRGTGWAKAAAHGVKKIDLSRAPESDLKDLIDEFEAVKRLSHDNIVVSTTASRCTAPKRCCSWSCATLATCTAPPARAWTLRMIRDYTGLLTKALAYIHEQKLTHRDVKSANVFLTLLAGQAQTRRLRLRPDLPAAPDPALHRESSRSHGAADANPDTHQQQQHSTTRRLATLTFLSPRANPRRVPAANPPGTSGASAAWCGKMLTGKPPWHDLPQEGAIYFKVAFWSRLSRCRCRTPPAATRTSCFDREAQSFPDGLSAHRPAPAAHGAQLMNHTFSFVMFFEVTSSSSVDIVLRGTFALTSSFRWTSSSVPSTTVSHRVHQLTTAAITAAAESGSMLHTSSADGRRRSLKKWKAFLERTARAAGGGGGKSRSRRPAEGGSGGACKDRSSSQKRSSGESGSQQSGAAAVRSSSRSTVVHLLGSSSNLKEERKSASIAAPGTETHLKNTLPASAAEKQLHAKFGHNAVTAMRLVSLFLRPSQRVVGCKSNYESERLATKVHLFPKDSVERERWKKALPNILESVTDHMGICAKHWPPDTTMVKKRRFEAPKDPPSISPMVFLRVWSRTKV